MKMKTIIALPVLFFCANAALVPAESKNEAPNIEVCFVLDTTGSMGDLIEGAKQKIWSIANEIIKAKPAPHLKIGLVAYRDRGDEYIVKSYPLTEDVDAVYANLTKFVATGGGDTPESVNEALAEAVNKMQWSDDKNTLKMIFLVGDAPPHMDYKEGPKYPEVCADAVKKGLMINTVQCGNLSETTPIWKEIAQLAEGSYAAIPQSGNVTVIDTPVDAKLAELNRKIGDTLIPYGSDASQNEVRAKQALSTAAPAAAAADRLHFNSATKKAVQGGGELLGAISDGKVDLDKIDNKELPAELRDLKKEEIKKVVDQKQQERESLQKEINALLKQRTAFIQAENKRRAESGKGDSFDEKVADIIHGEAAKKGIRYEAEANR